MLLLASLGLPLAVGAATCNFNLYPGTSCTNKAFQQDPPRTPMHPTPPTPLAPSSGLPRLRLLLPQVGQHDEQRRLLRAMQRRARLQSLGVGLNALGAWAPWELPPEGAAWPHGSEEVPPPPRPAPVHMPPIRAPAASLTPRPPPRAGP